MTKKELLKKIGEILLCVLSTLFFGITSIFLFQEKKEKENKKVSDLKATVKKNEVQNEIKKKNADDIINTSNDMESVQSGIQQQKDEFRQRIRDRLNTKL